MEGFFVACAHQICCSPSARFARHGRPPGPLSIHWECLIWPSAFRLYPDGCGTQKRLSHGGFGRTRHVECLSSCLKGLSCVPAPYRHTLTCGRGKEFLGFRQVNEALQGKRCSRHPGCPGERALHEQGNGLLRRFFPRRRDFSRLTNKETARAVALINHRPGKRSGHLSTAGQPQEKGILLAVCSKKCLCRPATKNALLPFNAAILPALIRRRRRSRRRRKDWRRFRQGGPGGRLPACAGGCPGAGCIQSLCCVPDGGRR